jgi:hypothetical protein
MAVTSQAENSTADQKSIPDTANVGLVLFAWGFTK